MIRYLRGRPGPGVLTLAVAGAAALVTGCSATPASLPHPVPLRSTQPQRPGNRPGPGTPTINVFTSPPANPAGPPAPSVPPAGSSGPPAPTPAPAPSPVPVPVPGCTTAGLRAAVGPPDGTAGSIYYPLQFTNISAVSCSLFGYPGVSFVAAPGQSGAEIGGPATRNPAFPAAPIVLAPGGIAHATLQVAGSAVYPAQLCKPVTAHWLRIYPPGEFDPLYARFTAGACAGSVPGGSTLGVEVITPGSAGS